jgi:hypothetical protein
MANTPFRNPGDVYTSDLIPTLPRSNAPRGLSCRVGTDGQVATVMLGTNVAGYDLAGVDALIRELAAVRELMVGVQA